MDRRSFFRLIMGFVAGIYAAFVPKKPVKWIVPEGSVPKRSGTKYVDGAFLSPIKRMTEFRGNLYVLLENGELWRIYEDSSSEFRREELFSYSPHYGEFIEKHCRSCWQTFTSGSGGCKWTSYSNGFNA